MDKPKPNLGWRDFFKKTGIIVLGVFIALSAEPAMAQDVMSYHVRHITLLAEDANTRVLRYAARTGDKTLMHSHPASVVYVLKGGRVKITGADGAVTIATLKTGTVLLRPPVTQAGEAWTMWK
jgi:quercetin dioxygenase-like cupin family protein